MELYFYDRLHNTRVFVIDYDNSKLYWYNDEFNIILAVNNELIQTKTQYQYLEKIEED